tara:strand:+ start:604 stop:921 length:318 start_codon:yes stop_codon:yes gene_type:complete
VGFIEGEYIRQNLHEDVHLTKGDYVRLEHLFLTHGPIENLDDYLTEASFGRMGGVGFLERVVASMLADEQSPLRNIPSALMVQNGTPVMVFCFRFYVFCATKSYS